MKSNTIIKVILRSLVFMFCLLSCGRQTKLIKHSREVTQELSRAAPLVRLQDILSINLDASVDLNRQWAELDYSITNAQDQENTFEFVSPLAPKKSLSLKIKSKASWQKKITGDVQVTSLSAHTFHASFRPYLLIKGEDKKDKLLIADYKNVRINIKMPEGTRLVKSSIRSLVQDGNEVIWDARGIKILPPIHLWYTSAPEDVTLTKRAEHVGLKVIVEIEVRNNTSNVIRNLSLSTQFPATLYNCVPESSDGEFGSMDEIMIFWKGTISRIRSGAIGTISYTILKNYADTIYEDSEVCVYNKDNQLIAIH